MRACVNNIPCRSFYEWFFHFVYILSLKLVPFVNLDKKPTNLKSTCLRDPRVQNPASSTKGKGIIDELISKGAEKTKYLEDIHHIVKYTKGC